VKAKVLQAAHCLALPDAVMRAVERWTIFGHVRVVLTSENVAGWPELRLPKTADMRGPGDTFSTLRGSMVQH